MRSYAIVGAGAVGGLYGARLHHAGAEVHFLLRSDYEHVLRHGLRVDSPWGNLHLTDLKAHRRPESMPPCDIVVLAWKTTQNGSLAEVLPSLLKPGGAVLVLQNGLDPEREMAAQATGAPILSGLCFLCSRKQGPGWILHQDYGSISLAAYSPMGPAGITEVMREVAGDFHAAGVETRLEEDWRQARWRKLVWNVPFNGLSALHKADTQELLAAPPLRNLLRELMDEVLEGARLAGCPLPANLPERMMADTEAMAPYETSMKLDCDSGRPMELEAIYGRTLEDIRARGGRAPRMEALYAQLRFLETEARPRGPGPFQVTLG